ncbi:MAG: HPP family protein [Magnetococcales bacterium]|nr:HPP family protein [Magnetococcales bacterium]
MDYLNKMRGNGSSSPPRTTPCDILWSWLGSFLGIALVAILNYHLLAESDAVLLIGSFGASAVLIFGAVSAPLAQPRNLIGGHFVSAIVGVTMFQMFGNTLWLAAALAVSLAIALMHITRTLHPPGGATALIAVIGSGKIHALGYTYAIIPVTTGALLMLLVALIVNNIPNKRQYPKYWW